jgi:uncharacterized protein (DUF934 family)
MAKLIKNHDVIEDHWTVVREAASPADLPVSGPVIVALALWQAHRNALRDRGAVGVWLGPTDDPAALVGDLAGLQLIAIDFPKFGDGRGYSTARLLRERYGYKGELRAIGDVLRDQLYAMAECGFDSFALRADRDPYDALKSLDEFTGMYASTTREPRPWFRRRHASTASSDSGPAK